MPERFCHQLVPTRDPGQMCSWVRAPRAAAAGRCRGHHEASTTTTTAESTSDRHANATSIIPVLELMCVHQQHLTASGTVPQHRHSNSHIPGCAPNLVWKQTRTPTPHPPHP